MKTCNYAKMRAMISHLFCSRCAVPFARGTGWLPGAALLVVLALALPVDAADTPPTPWPSLADTRAGYNAALERTFTVGDTRGSEEAFQRILNVDRLAGEYGLRAEEQAYVWSDLDEDGTDEVLMMAHDSRFCGSIGCWGVILARHDGHWTQIGGLSLVERIRIGSPRRGGFATVYSMDMCAAWNGARYETRGDDMQDGISIHPHACGKNYDRRLVNLAQRCNRCHLPDVYDRK